MDDRVKPGGDDREGTCRLLIIASAAKQSSGLRGKLDYFVVVAPRNDEWSKPDKVPAMRGANR
jgi:hypothetical protein